MLDKLLRYLPKNQRKMVDNIESEAGLIDDCKYMIYLKEGFEHYCYGNSFAIKNIAELKEFMKDVYPSNNSFNF